MTDASGDLQHRARSWLALLLLVPAATIGVSVAIYGWFGPAGRVVYGIAKLWLLLLPLIWHLRMDRLPVRISRPTLRSLLVATAWGVAIIVIILTAYWLLGRRWIDPQAVRNVASRNHLDRQWVYIAAFAWFCTGNALMEEYVWRWFVYRKAEAALPAAGSRVLPVLFAAACFTIHHVVALHAQFDWLTTILGSLGVFVGGVIWSGLYLKYRNIWPGFVSHMLADVGVFAVGYHILFMA